MLRPCATLSSPASDDERAAPADDCSCGQPLDCSHARHCPRCGVTRHAA
jgi:hypothetical protein